MDKVCRLCLQFQVNMTSIFKDNKGTSELQSKIRSFCSIEVSQEDVLPKTICGECEKKLTSIEEFRIQCKHSDDKLRTHYKIPNPKSMCNSSFNVLQDIAVQTEDKFKNDSTRSKCTYLAEEKNKLWVDVTSVMLQKIETDDDEEQDQKSDFVINETCQTDNRENDQAQKNDTNDEKSLKVQSRSDKISVRKSLRLTKKKEKLTCDLCQKVYVSKKSLLKHTEAHVKETIVVCKICDKIFNNNKKLTKHIEKHSNNMDLKCEVCDMPFKKQAKLNFHLRVHGKGPPINTDKQYLCDMCSRTFASKSGLRFHLKSHSGTKPYACKFCDKSFTIPSYKKRHERTHTGDKHFICHICTAGFASANGLKYHLRSHTGEANYHCNTCGKSFRRHKYLKEHIFIHTGEKPFICKICGSAYGNSGSLFVHEKKCKMQYVHGFITN